MKSWMLEWAMDKPAEIRSRHGTKNSPTMSLRPVR
jgi:hypothetical protein